MDRAFSQIFEMDASVSIRRLFDMREWQQIQMRQDQAAARIHLE
ncbi:hypothetical protein NPIL_71781, partial [Nephila pilipes]